MRKPDIEDTSQSQDPGREDASAASDAAPEATPRSESSGDLKDRVREALKGVTDPELGINIVDLGLVYDVVVEDAKAKITMTLTSPGCPAGGMILGGAKVAAEDVDGVEEAEVNLVWKPFWTPDRIDPAVRAMMGF